MRPALLTGQKRHHGKRPYASAGPSTDQSLVTEMLALSPRFAQMWAEHEVEVRGPMLKHVSHPQAGPLEFALPAYAAKG